LIVIPEPISVDLIVFKFLNYALPGKDRGFTEFASFFIRVPGGKKMNRAIVSSALVPTPIGLS
jgi:hypothetical protein